MVGAGPAYAVQYLTVEQAQRLCFAEATAFEPAHVTLTRDQMRAIGRARITADYQWDDVCARYLRELERLTGVS